MFKNHIKKIAKYILLMGFILNNTVLVFSMESISDINKESISDINKENINIHLIKHLSNTELINSVSISEIPSGKIISEFCTFSPSLFALIKDFNQKDNNQVKANINQIKEIKEAIEKLDDIFADNCQIPNMASDIVKNNHGFKNLLNDKSIQSLYIETVLVSCLYITSFLEENSKNFSLETKELFFKYLTNYPEMNGFEEKDLFNSELLLNNLPKLYKEIAKRSYDAFLHQRLIDNNIELEDLFNSTVTKKKMEDEQEKIDLILDLLNSSKEERQKKIKERNKPIKKQNQEEYQRLTEKKILQMKKNFTISEEEKEKIIIWLEEQLKLKTKCVNNILPSNYENIIPLIQSLNCTYAALNDQRFSIIQMQLSLIEQKNQINLIEQENFIDN